MDKWHELYELKTVEQSVLDIDKDQDKFAYVLRYFVNGEHKVLVGETMGCCERFLERGLKIGAITRYVLYNKYTSEIYKMCVGVDRAYKTRRFTE